jgi:hypothetical protein
MDLSRASGLDIRSSPYVEDNRVYMLSGTHEDGVTMIFDESEVVEVGYDGLNAELASAEIRRAREALPNLVETYQRNLLDPLYTAMTDGRIDTRTGCTPNGLRAGDTLAIRDANGRDGISRVASVTNNLFNIDPIAYENWRGRLYTAGGRNNEPVYISEGFWDNPFGEAVEGSEENPYKLGSEKYDNKVQLIARKKGWYAFAHLPEWVVELDTGIVEFDDNDFPKYVLDRKRI